MPLSQRQTLGLTSQILIALAAGASLGLLINFFAAPDSWLHETLVGTVFATIGILFIKLLKMMVVPLVLVSLVTGVSALGDSAKLGRIGGKAITLYLLTTTLAIATALLLSYLLVSGMPPEGVPELPFTPKEKPPFADVIGNLVPENPIAAMANSQMLQVLVFAILLGLGLLKAGEKAENLNKLFISANEVVLEIVMLVMKAAPIGVFCLIAKTFSSVGGELILKLGEHFFTVLLALFCHALITYTLILKLFARLDPIRFFKKMLPALSFAFSTASSSATIPVTMRTVEDKLGVNNSVASFTIPLGATINMDGTAIMQGVATVFIASIYGIDLSLTDYLMVILTATLASIGTAGVPGVGLITLAMVLNQVNLPVEGIALIIGVDRILDMVRTAVNITGDAVISCAIARSENLLDQSIFDNEIQVSNKNS